MASERHHPRKTKRFPAKTAIALLRLYQHTLSPDTGWFRLYYPYGYCRFFPTCSQYAIDALTRHGFVRGAMLAVRRLLHCHPWHKGGYDPVTL